MSYPLALALTLGLEVPVVAALYPRQRLRMGLVCAVATTATHLVMHFAVPGLVSSYAAFLLAGESLALFGEAGAYWLAGRPREPGLALLASALANALSFGVGLIVFA